MRRILLLLIILTPLINYSQTLKKETYTVTGKIIDDTTNKALEDATIVFKNLDSNTIKYGGITNARGKFSIEVEEGSYNASVEFISIANFLKVKDSMPNSSIRIILYLIIFLPKSESCGSLR